MKKIKIKNSGKHVIELKKPGEEVEIWGVFKTKNKQKIRVEIIVHHQAPLTRAITTLKGVADDQSRIGLVGRIKIEPNCGQTNSFLTQRVLLLSDQSQAEVVPDLEILTDDVKCSHAASISHLDEEQLFYLMSRGLSRTQAEKLIIKGFLKI